MTTTIRTLTPLDEIRKILGVGAWNFHNFSVPECLVNTDCAGVWSQGINGGNIISRDELAMAVKMAEDMIENITGYSLAPRYYKAETIHPDKSVGSVKPLIKTGQITKAGRKRGHLIGLGVKKEELLGSFDIVPTDYDGDGFNETAVIDISDYSNVNINEITAFYHNHEDIEIRPIKIKDTGQIRKIEFPMYLIPKWELIYPLCETALDSEEPENYETKIDVYRVYLDRSEQINLVYYPGSYCTDTINYEKTLTPTLGYVVDGVMGWFNYNPSNAPTPNEIQANFMAGYTSYDNKRPMVEIDSMWVMPVMALAISLVDPLKSCCGNNTPSVVTHWRRDLLLETDDSRTAQFLGVSSATLRNWDKAGKLVAYRHPINGYRLYLKADLESLLNNVKQQNDKS